jgi:tetratricopeptide (TPR) repeat protein
LLINPLGDRWYRRSLAEHPDYVAPALALAALMARRGAPAAEVEAAPPERPSALALAATAHYEAGRVEEAERWYRAVLAAQPRNGAARVGLLEALLSQRRYAEAAEGARDAATGEIAAAAAGIELFARAAGGDAAGLEAALGRGCEAGVPDHELALYNAWRAVLGGGAAPASLPLRAALTALAGLEAFLRVQDFDNFAVLHDLYGRVELSERERRELLARIYLRRGYLDSAAEEWIAAGGGDPDAPALIGLSQVALAQGMHDHALALAADALILEPNAEVARIHAGIAARLVAA